MVRTSDSHIILRVPVSETDRIVVFSIPWKQSQKNPFPDCRLCVQNCKNEDFHTKKKHRRAKFLQSSQKSEVLKTLFLVLNAFRHFLRIPDSLQADIKLFASETFTRHILENNLRIPG